MKQWSLTELSRGLYISVTLNDLACSYKSCVCNILSFLVLSSLTIKTWSWLRSKALALNMKAWPVWKITVHQRISSNRNRFHDALYRENPLNQKAIGFRDGEKKPTTSYFDDVGKIYCLLVSWIQRNNSSIVASFWVLESHDPLLDFALGMSCRWYSMIPLFFEGANW